MGKEISASLGFIVEAILGIMGSQSLLHLEALTVRLSVGSVVRSCCLLYLVGSVVRSHTILCPLVRA